MTIFTLLLFHSSVSVNAIVQILIFEVRSEWARELLPSSICCSP